MADEVRLIDAGKLIGYLHEKTFIDGDDRSMVYKAIEEQPTIEAEPDKGWISVEDRLPDGNGKYIVWSDGELNICEYDVESQTFGDTFYDYDEMYSKLLCWDDDINKFVTHWLPLSEPPKKDKDKGDDAMRWRESNDMLV